MPSALGLMAPVGTSAATADRAGLVSDSLECCGVQLVWDSSGHRSPSALRWSKFF